MELAIMLEGQHGLTWLRWQRIAKLVEESGFVGLYRSDHFTNRTPPDFESLECWISLTWLASHTSRIEFGPLVSPVSFRHPAMLARIAAQIDDLSGGRLQLGVGAGWQEREHTNFGYELLDITPRFDRLGEGLEVITRLLRNDTPVDFAGTYYRLNEAVLLPRPQRRHGPPIVIGGNGKNRTLGYVARYADEWNAVFIPPTQFSALNERLDGLIMAAGRNPHDVRRSLMTGLLFGRDHDDLNAKLAARNVTIDDLRARGMLVGTPETIKTELSAFAAVGVQRLMIQWMELDNLDGLELLARSCL
jgi:F420-dependent oxidoreductase-like protein